MAEPLLGVDKHGLSTTARSWTPRGMLEHQDGRDALEAFADALADLLNPLIDMEQYLPIILNPTRCLDGDIFRTLELNGIDLTNEVVSFAKQRRLAILGPELRSWRGAFRSHRAVSSALMAGPTIIRTWLTYRFVLDEGTLSLVLVFEGIEDLTHIFVLGQGPSAENFIEAELNDKLLDLAVPVLDSVEITPCWALTAWRNGVGTWVSSGLPVLVAVTGNTTELGEFEALDTGPAVDSTAVQLLVTPTQSDVEALDETQWVEARFKTDSVPLGEFWDLLLYYDPTTSDAYGARIRAGNSTVTLHRYTAGVPGAALGTIPANLGSSLEGDYIRIDLLVHKNASATRLRVIIDGNPSGWFDDAVVAGRPAGTSGAVRLDTADFTAGILRIGALTFRKNE